MTKKFISVLITIIILSGFTYGSSTSKIGVKGILLTGVPGKITLSIPDNLINKTIVITNNDLSFEITPDQTEILLENIILKSTKDNHFIITSEGTQYKFQARTIPGWTALIPPIVAIMLAMITREMLLSLFIGIWSGSILLYNYNPIIGFFKSFDTHVVHALADSDHAAIIIFTLLFGGMIGLISKNGGMFGIVQAALKYAGTRRKGQLVTSLMGCLIFFDDYSNSLLIGNTMRPFTDKVKLSREKLAYIVDSTAAPVANLAPISTWSVFEMSLLTMPFAAAGITASPYIVFLKSIPYSFYGIFSLWLLIWLGVFKRDFGPMHKAEDRAFNKGKVIRDGANPLMDDSGFSEEFGNVKSHWSNALLPILAVLATTFTGLYLTGLKNLDGADPTLQNIIGNSDSYASLMWGAAMGCMVGIILSLSKKLLNLRETVDAWLSGVRSMTLAVLVLTLAWTLSGLCMEVQTAEYLIHHIGDHVNGFILPIVTFILAGMISFSTGTSWGTMSILVPLIIPIALKVTGNNVDSQVFLGSFAAIMAGSTFGDHCSPISDTTILSSMASACDHIDHVRTQMPYALLAGLFSIVFGYFFIGLGWYNIFILFLAFALMILIILFYGKNVETMS
jgi:Na+/H+ antiporter NhaC